MRHFSGVSGGSGVCVDETMDWDPNGARRGDRVVKAV